MVNQKRENALLDEAYFRIKRKEFNNAKFIFDKIFALNPNNPNAIVGKAYCFYRQLNNIQAYKLCKDIKRDTLNRNYLEFYKTIIDATRDEFLNEKELMLKEGMHLIRLDEYSAAISYFNKVLDLEYDDNAIVGKAYSLYKLNYIYSAFKSCQKVNRDNLKLNFPRWYDIITQTKKYVLKKDYIAYHFDEAYKFIESKDFKTAKKFFEKIADCDNANLDAKIGIAYCFYGFGNISHARTLCSFIDTSKLNETSLKYYNEIYHDENSTNELIIDIDKLLKEAGFLINRGEFSDAIDIFDKVLEYDPNNDNAIVGKAYCHYTGHEKDTAYDSCNQVKKDNLNSTYLKLYNKIILDDDMKICPKCGKIVKSRAIRCKYCNHYFKKYAITKDDVKNLSNIESLDKAFKLISKNQYSNASIYLDKVLNEEPDNAFALYGKSFCLANSSKYFEALELFEKAIKIDKSLFDENYYNFLKEFSEKYDSKSAKTDDIPEGKKCCPDCGRIVNDYAMRCVSCNHYFEDNWMSDYEYPLIDKLRDKGKKLLKEGKYKQALIIFNQILDEDSNDFHSLFGKIFCFKELGEYTEALQICGSLKEIEYLRNDENFNNLVSEIKEKLDENKEEATFEELIDMANKEKNSQNYKEALNYYDEALSLEPHNIYLLNQKGQMLLSINEFEQAINAFDDVLSIDSDYMDSILGKSYALYFIGKYHESLNCFKRVKDIFDVIMDEDFYNELLELTKR